MKCALCKKECLKDELTEGLCDECLEKNYAKRNKTAPEHLEKYYNKVAQKIRWLIYATWAVGAIYTVIETLINYDITKSVKESILFFVVRISVVIFSTVVLEALAEIVQLLQDIKDK